MQPSPQASSSAVDAVSGSAATKQRRLKPAVIGAILAAGIALPGVSLAIWAERFSQFWGMFMPSVIATILLNATAVQGNLSARITMMHDTLIQALDAQTRVEVRNMAERGTVTDTQIANSAVAQIQAEGALAAWRQGQDVTRQMKESRDKLVQPLTTCVTITGGIEMPRAAQTASAAAGAATSIDRKTMTTQATGLRSAETNYAYVMKSFCSQADVDRGRCQSVVSAKVANGDLRAGLLFGNEEGNLTRDAMQEQAVQAVIERLAGVRRIPDPLPDPDAEKTAQGKLYEETRRDYAAISQLASNSLQQIRMNHRSQAGVGASLKSAGIAGDHIPDDISMADAARVYVDSVLSPSAVKDMAGATDPLPIMRQLVQSDTFDLWFQFQQLQSAQRLAAINATALALENERHTGDKARAQAQAARLISGN